MNTITLDEVKSTVKRIFDNNCARTTKSNLNTLSGSIYYHINNNSFQHFINIYYYEFYFPLVSPDTLKEIKTDLILTFYN